MEITTCKKCRKPIFFGQVGDKAIPIDKERVTVKKEGMYFNSEGRLEKCLVGQLAFQSHFISCPYRKQFAQMRYRRKKADESLIKNILLHDLAGMEVVLSKCCNLAAMKKRWESLDFQTAYKRLSEEEKQKLIFYKNDLKARLSEKQLAIGEE